ncbi:MAG TPA: serine/threonine-protein kinase PknK, partial [Polyangia bacterium]
MESSSELIVEETIRQDQQCVLRRGRRSPDAQPILTLEPRWDHPSPEVIARLEREFALRGELSPDWALVPLALESNHGKTALIFADAGGIPLDQCGEMPWPLAKFWPVAIRICVALAQIHDKGLVHKDVKPANILLNPETGQVRLMNFGLATRLPRERPALDPPELIAGTLAYMAPEQTGRMNRSVDSRSDLYSLGVTFYELLTGTLPFAANDPTDWVHCHLAREPVAPTSRNRSLPAPLSDLVLKLLAKSPEARYQTAAGLQSDLERLAAQWSEHHDLTPFPLGSHDKSDRLLIPEKLYGRSREVRDLHTAFERVVTQGAPQVVLVAGYSGAGKSSLIGELHKVISLPRGIFAAGKFEQHKRGIPYASLAQAFQGLIRQLLVRPEDELRRWRETILAQVEDRGQLIIDLVPELAYIIGSQPALPALPGQESQNRFHTVFAQFVAAFARREHPLVLFLDDLQWQDGASLRLVEHLVTHPELPFLLFVGAYRNNEVSATHPLMVTLDAIRAAGVAITDLPLGPLQLADVTRLVSETLRMPEPRVQPLARLVHDKTGGNPFFAIQFLTAIHDQRLLFFDQEEQGWRWDLDAIRGRGFSDNVADLMVARLRGLPRPTVDALKALAFLGNAASTAHLALVEGLSEDQIDRDLWEALRAGLIVRAPGGYRFLHDRIQEAADSMIPAATRPHEHLRIARLLLAGLSAEAREKNQEEVPADNLDRNLEDNLFSLVRHFNQGVDLVTDESERDLVRRLNVAAGHRAKAAIAYGLAREYFARAFQRLPEDAWQSSYDETFALALDLSECELLAGNFDRADELFGIILDAARTNADRGKTQRLRSRLYRTQGRYDAALAVLTDGLRAFGLTFPDSDGAMKDALDLACAETEVLLGGRSIASLLEAPTVTDPAAATVIAMLSEAQACAYPINSPLFPLIVRKAVNHSLRFGNCSESCFAYSMHAVLLGRQWGDMKSALAFSELSLKLADKFGETEYSGVVRLIHAAAVSFWAQPFAVGRPYLEDAFRICIATGDLGHASATGIFTSWLLLESGAALPEIRAASEKFAAFARQVKNEVMQQTVLQMVSFADCLDGDPPDATVPGCAPFNQVERKRLFDETHFLPGNAYGYILAQLVGLIHGRFEESLAAARAAQAYLSGIVGTPGEASHHFYYALALAAVCRTAAEDQKGELADSLAAEIAILKTQADTCPANYFDRHALALAEQARLEGAHDQAMQLYDRAISAAHANGFGLNEALACELAGEFYLSLGLERNARGYLRDARAGYLHWGAAGKVKQLDRRHPRLAAPAPSPTSTIAAPAQQLDLPNVVKAAQAVAGEIVLGRLIEKLLTIVVDLAGASRGLLILPSLGAEDAFVVQAEATTGKAGIEVRTTGSPLGEA